MARFRNSNRMAAAEMNYMASRNARKTRQASDTKSYFERIGFDHAMI